MSVKQRETIVQACRVLHLYYDFGDETVVIQTTDNDPFMHGTIKDIALGLEGALAYRKYMDIQIRHKANIEVRANALNLIVQFEDDGRCCIQTQDDFDFLVDGTLEQAHLVLGTLEKERGF